MTKAPNDNPYTPIAGDLVADVVLLMDKVQDFHPNLSDRRFGDLIVNVDLSTKLIIVCFRLPDDSVLVAEQIRIDNDPKVFGTVVEPATPATPSVKH